MHGARAAGLVVQPLAAAPLVPAPVVFFREAPLTAAGFVMPDRSALSRLANRLRLRDAVLRWIVPLSATLSSRLEMLLNSCSVLATSPLAWTVVKLLSASFRTDLR